MGCARKRRRGRPARGGGRCEEASERRRTGKRRTSTWSIPADGARASRKGAGLPGLSRLPLPEHTEDALVVAEERVDRFPGPSCGSDSMRSPWLDAQSRAGSPPCLASPRVRDPLVTRRAVRQRPRPSSGAGSHGVARSDIGGPTRPARHARARVPGRGVSWYRLDHDLSAPFSCASGPRGCSVAPLGHGPSDSWRVATRRSGRSGLPPPCAGRTPQGPPTSPESPEPRRRPQTAPGGLAGRELPRLASRWARLGALGARDPPCCRR
jgi:hypothetical protein